LSGLHDLLPEAEARALSPIHAAPPRACNVFATAGECESAAFKAQGRAIVDAWAARGCAGEYADSPGDNHFTICQRLAHPADPLTQRIAALTR